MHDDKIENLIHLYMDGAFNRRELLQRLVRHTGSLAAAAAVMESAGLNQAQAACPADVRVPENAPDLETAMVTLSGEGGPLFAYLVLPRAAAGMPRPAVLVIHENRGLNDHIKDVTRRVARAGYVALGIDLLSRQGGTGQFPDPEQAGAAYNRTRPEERRQDMRSALLTLKEQPYVLGGRLGAIGFCAGGGNCFDLAVNSPELAAAVVFYGAVPNPIDLVGNITAPLLGFFAELDRRTTAGVAPLITALLDGQKTFGLHVYENTRHAFHNDTGAAYDPAAACDAWTKTLEFFDRHLNGTKPPVG